VWIRSLLRAIGRGLAGAAAILGPTVSPWPIAADWSRCPFGRCDDCRCLPGPGHPERLATCPPDEVESALWAQFEVESPRSRRP